jgi:hypothetical protein
MNQLSQTLIDKILALYVEGLTDYRSIQEALKRPTQTVNATTQTRPAYAAENKLALLLIPNVVSFGEIMAAQDKVEFVAQRLKDRFAAAELADKLNILALSAEIQNAFLEVKEAGSKGFSDPDFLTPTVQGETISYGPSWLEENGFAEYPSKYEILDVLGEAGAL